MERDLQLFNFKGTSFTVITIEDKSYWVAKEICEELDIKNHSDATNKLKDGSQKRKLSYEECKQIGLNDKISIPAKGLMLVTHEGIEKLIISSVKPKAIKIAHDNNIKIINSTKEQDYLNIIERSCSGFIDDFVSQFTINKYRIDLYSSKFKLAIECDEFEHKKYKDDKRRERYLMNKLDCTFIRFNPDEKNFNIGEVINRIFKYLLKSSPTI